MIFSIKQQNYEVNGYAPLSYAVFVSGYDVDHQNCWGDPSFVCYSWSYEGALRALRLIQEGI